MKVFGKRKRQIGIICIFLLLFSFVAGCQPTSNSTGTSVPEAPASLNIDNNENHATSPYLEEKDVQVEFAEVGDGSQNVNITTPQVLPAGNYMGIYETEDGKQFSVPCELVSGTGNELECPLVSVDDSLQIHLQLYYSEIVIPLFGDKVGFSQDVLDVFIQPRNVILPKAYHAYKYPGSVDSIMYLYYLCSDWAANDRKPDDLDPTCSALAFVKMVTFGPFPSSPPADPLSGGIINPLADPNDIRWDTMPDPDCAGKDAGSFWCQESGDDIYLSGRLAVLCQNELGIIFEDPLTAFEDPLTAFEDPLTAFEDPLTAFEDPLTAFEDPLTAFEDPLTAFEDPLTAFEDPLTAFEDPLTAFEDPLTAIDVARITLLYTAMKPFLSDTSKLPACNYLTLLGDYSSRSRSGEPLFSVIQDHFSIPKEMSSQIGFQAPGFQDTGEHCNAFSQTQITNDWFIANTENPQVQLNFSFSNGIPDITFETPDDPFPYIYTATLGDAESGGCTRLNINEDTMKCIVNPLDQSSFGQLQPVSVYVSGCSEPIYQSNIILPEYDYSRCDIFSQFNYGLHVSRASTNLQFYITKSGGIPGPNTWDLADYPGFDQMFLFYFAFFDDISTMEINNPNNDPGVLFVDFEVPYDYLVSPREFRLYTNQCASPIFSKTIQVIKPAMNPTATQTGNDNPPPTPVVCEGPPPFTCQIFDWGSCRCTKCADGYVDDDLDGICTELN
jgi:hypothetical protein